MSSSEITPREALFRNKCPALFHDTDPSRLPAESLRRVLAYRYGPRGMILHSVSGRGKTRAMWLLMRRLIVDEERVIFYRDAFDFGAEASDAYRQGEERSWIQKAVEADGVFLDDLGKAKFTQRAGEALFKVVDGRTSKKRPTFITTNLVGEKLKLRFDDQDLAEPLLRRLREFFDTVAF